MTVITAEQSELQDRILSQIAAKHWSHIDETWAEALEEAELPLSFHQPIIQKLARRRMEKLKTIYEPYIKDQTSKGRGELAVGLCEAIIAEDDSQEWVRALLIDAIRDAHKDFPTEQIEDFLVRSGLDEDTTNLRKGLAEFDGLLGATVGQVFRHTTWGLGIVVELDIQNGSAVIDFQTRKGQRMTLEGIRNFLERIPRDQIEARAVKDVEGLRAEASGTPATILRLALKGSKGRIKVADLKRIFLRSFMTESQYKSFWEKAKGAIKLDPWIEQRGSGLHAELFLRDKPQSFLDEIIKRLAKAATPESRRDVLRDVQKHGNDAEMTDDDRLMLQGLFAKPLADGALKQPWEVLAHGLLFEEFNDLFGEAANPVDLDELLRRDDIEAMLRHINVHELRRIALQRMSKSREDWAEVFSRVMPGVDTRTAAWMERALKERGEHHFHTVGIENVFARPGANPELFSWTAKNLLKGEWPELADSLPRVMIMEEVFSLLSELQERVDTGEGAASAEAKNQVTKVRTLLNENNSTHFKKAVTESTIEEGRRMMRTIRLHDALPDPLKHSLETILVNHHKELRLVSRTEEEEEKRKPAFHYTTAASLDQQREMLSQLKKDTRDMATVIETAREMGDLRENAEYHAAKDRQKLLMQQAAELEDLIARARVVDARDEDQAADQTRFGTRVTLRITETGEEKRCTLMGMWEADLSNQIISYLTPFGSQLLGRKVGDIFVVVATDGTKTEYELLTIEDAMRG